MATVAAARRYAQAVFDIASTRSELDRWRDEIREIVRVTADAQVYAVLESPRVPFAEKQEVLNKLLPGISPLVMNLAYVLVKARRLNIAGRMLEIFSGMVDAHKGIVHAQVTTAVQIDEQEQQFLADWLGRQSGKQVMLQNRLDPGIIGGVVVRVGDQVMDASVRTKLDRMKRNLLKAGTPA
ncbi:MAG: ATP synthase F1 subunit delta [Chloroflexi bacterium]|nr:ATP synthase F1 subunit delta [Chloroflexota bacterium]